GININPDNLGPRPRTGGTAFPTFIQSYFFKPSIYLYQSCLGDTAYHFTINNSGSIDSVRWDFGDPASGALNTSTQFSPWHGNSTDSTFQVTQPGIYWVEIETECGPYRDSVQVDFLTPPVFNLGNDLSLCNGETFTLKPNLTEATYVWQDGSTKDSLVIDK